MPNMDIFKQDAFSSTSLTTFINGQDFVPGYVGESVDFNNYGVTTTSIAIEQKDTVLGLIQTSPRGSTPPQTQDDKRVVRQLTIPRIAKGVTVYADQIQNVRPFGSQTELQSVQGVVNPLLKKVLLEVDMTVENLRLGAFRGLILDANGAVIYNLFTEFGVTQAAEVDFALDTATTDVKKICRTVRRTMKTNLKLANNGRFKIQALCSDEFYDALINHEQVVAAYDRYMGITKPGDDVSGFPYGDIWFENYQGTDDKTSVAVAANKVVMAPVGVPGLWENPYAPADTIEFVNTPGLPRYVLPDPENKNSDRAVHFEVQSNTLPFCTRPLCLMKGKKA